MPSNWCKLIIRFSGWSGFCFTPKMWRSFVRNILLMFYLGHEWTPHDELYDIADQLIDPNFGLHQSIGILELSTFDLEVWMIPIVYSIDYFSMTGRYKIFKIFVNCSFSFWGWSDFCFTTNMWQSFDVLLWGMGGHLVTSYMALQINRSTPVLVYTSQLAFSSYPPSI